MEGSSTTHVTADGARSACEMLLTDKVFEGEGRIVLEISSRGSVIGCSIELRSRGQALANLGITTECPEGAAVFVAINFYPDARSFVIDKEVTEHSEVDECTTSVNTPAKGKR